ncbi:MAG: hypothetical protein ABI551_06940 [Polyangiaceae bacterium]
MTKKDRDEGSSLEETRFQGRNQSKSEPRGVSVNGVTEGAILETSATQIESKPTKRDERRSPRQASRSDGPKSTRRATLTARFYRDFSVMREKPARHSGRTGSELMKKLRTWCISLSTLKG